ncbi:hypothetical protein BDV19DRAFT_373569 [Aspergillus venezuelensis]
MTMSALDVTFPLHLEKASHYQPSQTALAFIPLMVPAFFAHSPQIQVYCYGPNPIEFHDAGRVVRAGLGVIVVAGAIDNTECKSVAEGYQAQEK